ncbi:MAG: tetratricopeptide repeat protein [candidate division KSB1 bacterium]|nr:tetratricopeptide repeat protein [candidate division KSB1 bacterium]
MSNKPTLSLCMIVKDEENHLPVCLESVKNLVDEIIVVDTGSTDKTEEIARSYGAKIYHYQWHDDYAAARNESLNHATGDWVLYLDADERIREQDIPKIKEIISHEDIFAVNVPVVIPQPPGNVVTSFAVNYCRLFRNHPLVRFEGAAHEQILPSIQRLGGKVVKSDIVIDHWAYGDTMQRCRDREQENLKLLLKELEAAPLDPFIHYHLALTYRSLNQTEAAINEFEQVLALDDGSLKRELIAITYTFLAQAYLAKGDHHQALENSYKAIQMLPEEPLPYYLAAAAALEKQDFEMAIESLRQILNLTTAQHSSSPIAEIDLAQVYLDLGNCYYKLQRLTEAETNYREAVRRNPESWEIHFNLGNCYFRMGRYLLAQQFFERTLELNPSFEAARSNLLICQSLNSKHQIVKDG